MQATSSRHRTRLCICRLRCRQYNPFTDRYEGSGKRIPSSTCTRHLEDEESAELRHQLPHQLYHSDHWISTNTQNSRSFTQTHHWHDSSHSLESQPNSPIDSRPMSPISSQSMQDPLTSIEEETAALEAYSGPQRLVFVGERPNSPYQRPQDASIPNSGPCVLKPTSATNYTFLLIEARLCTLLRNVRLIEHTERQAQVQARIEHALDVLHSYKEMEWENQRLGESTTSLRINTGGLN